MWKYVLGFMLFALCSVNNAHAANCASYPYTLTNGQTADANQVMANFNNILSCGNNNLLGKSNNLSDLQSPATARTNLGLGAAAVENLSSTAAGAVTDDGAGNLVVNSFPTFHSQKFTTNGTFTVPSSATSSTVFKFTVIGGGGGGGSTVNSGLGGGGGSGGAVVVEASGFTASASVSVAIGSGGTGRTNSGVSGATGNSSTVVYNASTIITATGGVGGPSAANCTNGAVPVAAAGSGSASSGGGATILNSWGAGAQPGLCPGGASNGGNGGSNSIGTGGYSGGSAGSGPVAASGVLGGGGGGVAASDTGHASGNGGDGTVIVEWIL